MRHPHPAPGFTLPGQALFQRERVTMRHAWLACVAAAVGTAACGCQETPQVERGVSAVGVAVDQETWDFTFALTQAGIPHARVRAGHMVKYREEDFYRLDDSVRVDFFNAAGVRTSRVTSDSGRVDRSGKAFSATGRVHAAADSGITLYTRWLEWTEPRREIFTDAPVVVITGGDTVRGVGLTAAQDLSRWRIARPQGVSERRLELK